MSARIIALVAVLFCAPCLMMAWPARAETAFHDQNGGWHEAWIGVSDIDRTRAFFIDVAGWSLVDEGPLDGDTLDYLAPDATGGRYAVLRAPDYPQGWVRLIALEGVERRVIRSNAQSWDTGGIFSLMTRSADLSRNLADAERLGWTAYNDPYDFGFSSAQAGDMRLRNIVLRGPDGLNVAIYEWVTPKLADAPPAGALSKAFNAMQMVADLDAARAFYVDALGFRVVQEGAFVDPQPTPTNFGLPVNLSTTVERRFVIAVPEAADDAAGRVELMQFVGVTGRDLSARAGLHELGIVSLIFPTDDLKTIRKRLKSSGLPIIRDVSRIEMPPYGSVRALTTASPEGAYLTFVEARR